MKQKKWIAAPSFYIFWAVFCLLDEEGVMPLFFCAAVIHEAGHAGMIYLCGGRIEYIYLSITGAVLRQGKGVSYPAEICIALSGPAAGILAAIISTIKGWTMFAGANLLLSLFNLLPILPLDGGCSIQSFLCLLPAPTAEKGIYIFRVLSAWISVLMVFFGIFLLKYTGQNASALAAGAYLLFANMTLLHEFKKYGMIKKKNKP